MAPLADASALEARLGRSLTGVEATRAAAFLDDASALVIAYTRWNFTLVTDDSAVLRGDWGSIRLPKGPVTGVKSVTAIGLAGLADVPVTGWMWDGLDRILVDGWAGTVINLPEAVIDQVYDHPPTYRVVYSHGYTAVPGDVVSVVCGMVLRPLMSPTLVTGLVQESVGPYHYRLEKETSGTQVQLTAADKAVLSEYRRSAAMLRL
jgi:hypothetical protein